MCGIPVTDGVDWPYIREGRRVHLDCLVAYDARKSKAELSAKLDMPHGYTRHCSWCQLPMTETDCVQSADGFAMHNNCALGYNAKLRDDAKRDAETGAHAPHQNITALVLSNGASDTIVDVSLDIARIDKIRRAFDSVIRDGFTLRTVIYKIGKPL